MGYQIRYNNVGKLPKTCRRSWTGWVAGFLVLVLLAGAITVKAVGLRWVEEVLLPGDPAVTAAALEAMAEELHAGKPLGEAITGFCEEIMRYAKAAE